MTGGDNWKQSKEWASLPLRQSKQSTAKKFIEIFDHCNAVLMNHRLLFSYCSRTTRTNALRSVPLHGRPLSSTAVDRDDTISNATPVAPILTDYLELDITGKPRKRLPNDKDIIIGDMKTTLELHRKTNRASLVRKVKTSFTDPRVFRPTLLPVDEASSKIAASDKTSAVSKGEKKLKPGLQAQREAKKDEKMMIKQERDESSSVVNKWPKDSIQYHKEVGKTVDIKDDEILEYEGTHLVRQFPWVFFRRNKVPQSPWLGYMENQGSDTDSIERLNGEIKGFEAYMRLNQAETMASDLAITSVKSTMQAVVPESTISIIGSYATGLATPTSDIDFTFSLSSYEKDPLTRGPSATRPEALRANYKALQGIRRNLHKSPDFRGIEYIPARIPIVSAVHFVTGRKIQIQSLAPFLPAREYTATYLVEFPTLRPLFILLRYALEMRGLSTVFEGGLGSYSLLMLIVTAFKHASGKYDRHDLAGHLLHVLGFYADADLYHDGYSADPPRVFPKIRKSMSVEERKIRSEDPILLGIDTMNKFNPKKPYLLCLQDPANPTNDLGSKAYAIKHVQALFKSVKIDLTEDLKRWDHFRALRLPYRHALLNRLVRANYDFLEAARARVEKAVGVERDDEKAMWQPNFLDLGPIRKIFGGPRLGGVDTKTNV